MYLLIGFVQILFMFFGMLQFYFTQNIFGQVGLSPTNKSLIKTDVVDNKYRLQPKVQFHDFIHSLLVNPDNFKIASESLSQPIDKRIFIINYGDYQLIEGSYYPSEIKIFAIQEEEQTKIVVNYKKIDWNVSIRFPFTIPNGYKEIQLN